MGAYLFHLQFNPVNPNLARGAFTFTGQWTGDAFADFLLGYPSAAQVGIGRADEHGRTTWLHMYGQDDWADTTQSHCQLRVAIRDQRSDERCRQSSVGDRSVRAWWTVCRRERWSRQHLAGGLCVTATNSGPIRDVERRRMELGTAPTELSTLCAAAGHRLGARSRSPDCCDGRVWRLSESVGV